MTTLKMAAQSVAVKVKISHLTMYPSTSGSIPPAPARSGFAPFFLPRCSGGGVVYRLTDAVCFAAPAMLVTAGAIMPASTIHCLSVSASSGDKSPSIGSVDPSSVERS
jgi:hypothetical protein